MKKIYQILAVCSFAFLLACGDKSDIEQNITPSDGARVKFYHLAPDAAGVTIFANDQKLSGVLTVSSFPPATQLTPNVLVYGGTFPNLDYAVIAGGTAKIKVVVPATSTTPEIPAISAELPFESNKFYSVYAYGTSPTYSAFVLNDDFTAADPKKAYVRFINLVNTTTPTNYDLSINGVSVFSNVAFKGTSAAFTAIDPIVYNSTKVTVTAKSGATSISGGTTFSLQPYAGRFYTVILSGIAGGTGAKAPTLFVSTNK
jgi:Domain of unknown function (DUF4397)